MSRILGISNLTMAFGGVRAVQQFDLLLEEGGVHGLIGPNGAGKTTIFNVVTGIYRPQSGSVLFEGRELVGRRPFDIANAGIGRTFQNIRLFPNLSALENVIIAGHKDASYGMLEALTHLGRYGRVVRAQREHARELLAIVGLDAREKERAGSLPYGLQRRLEIARALAIRPRLLLLDEPAAGMNEEESVALVNFIREIRRRFSLTIFMIEHHMDVVTSLCDEITVLNFGKILARSSCMEEIKKNPSVVEAYLGKE